MKKKKLRVLLLMHEDLVPPEDIEGLSYEQMAPWKTEYDVWAGLYNLGHDVMKLGVSRDLDVISKAIEEFRPHIAFNLLEEFHGVAMYDHHVVSFLELMKKPYTGCNPRGLLLAHDKALSKQVLTYHRIRTPEFCVFPIGRKVTASKLPYPLLVKSLTEEGSVGISQASIVYDYKKLVERVSFVHRHVGTDAIAERYVDGREFYVGMVGNIRLQTFPIWELIFDNMPIDSARIATSKVKWDLKYQERVGVRTEEASGLSDAEREQIIKLSKRIYRVLNLSGYARLDFRLDSDGRLYLLEANPNPQLAYGEDFAESAAASGLSYEQVLSKILSLGLSYRPAWRIE